MKIALAVLAATAVACSQGALGPDSNTGATPTTVFEGGDAYDALAVQDGFLYLEVPGVGVERCPVGGCTMPTNVVDDEAFVAAALAGGTVTYSTQIGSAEGVTGEIRSIAVDGSDDRSVLGGLTYPAYVASSGQKTFWVEDSFSIDDTPAVVNCVGCSSDGSSQAWIMGIGGGTYGMIADASNVYVLADDPTLTSVELLACSVGAPCWSEPRVVIGGLDGMMTAQRIASDGTHVYVARADDVVRVDPSGALTTLATGSGVSALAFDAASGDLYYGTSGGKILRVAADGSSEPTVLATATDEIAALAFDQTSVYALTGTSGSVVVKTPK